MTEHRIGTQEEWQAQRDKLLAEEKELTREVARFVVELRRRSHRDCDGQTVAS